MKQKYFLVSIAATALLSLGTTSCTFNFGDEEKETWNGSNPGTPENPDNPQNPDQPFNPEDPNSTMVDDQGNLHIGWFVYKPLTANTAEFSLYDQEPQGSMVIPETITVGGKTYTVTAIGENAFGGRSQLSSVTMPATITTIGNWAFNGCENLKDINLPEGLVTIGESALSRTAITSLTIPSTVTTIGNWAFDNTALTSLVIPATVTSIGEGIVNECKQLKSITLSCKEIRQNMLGWNLTALSEVILNEGVETIGEGAFSNLGITSLTIPSSVTTIGNWAFSECKGLTAILIPASITKLGDGAFAGCTGVTEITVLNKDLTLDNWPFANDNVQKVTLNCATIAENAFSGWPKLAEVVLGDDVETISNNAFGWSQKLATITLGKAVKTIGENAFNGCALTKLTIPNSVTTIGNGAFVGCNLTSITIPASVTNLGDMAFGSSLKEVKCLATTPPVIDIPWEGASGFDWELSENGKLYVPAASIDAYKAADGWKEFKSIIAL